MQTPAKRLMALHSERHRRRGPKVMVGIWNAEEAQFFVWLVMTVHQAIMEWSER
jgi:hypothetical protein